MSTAMAFLSGKGGSGKTTLALSMADLMRRCGVNTLLVDCDLSTNGATYFYETQLGECNATSAYKTWSFHDILNGIDGEKLPLLKIEDKFNFIPSVSEISGKCLIADKWASADVARHLLEFINWAKDHYDVVLFDCQAGYSEFLPALLPQMDADLFVLEADNISASAMRSLHLKIGDHLGSATLYQVFNKATQEEFDIYSKIVGTFFTNIGTLLFDWKIRQAFSRSQVPDIETSSEQYGQDLCNICKVIFRDKVTREGLARFSAQVQYQKLKAEQMQVKSELRNLVDRPSLLLGIRKLIIPSMIISILTMLFILLFDGIFDKRYPASATGGISWTSVVAFIAAMLGIFAGFLELDNARKRRRQERWDRQEKLKEIENELIKLNEELTKTDNS